MYGLDQDMIAAGIVIATVASAPLMYVSGGILGVLEIDLADFLQAARDYGFPLTLMSIGFIICTTIILLSRIRILSYTHLITGFLLISG